MKMKRLIATALAAAMIFGLVSVGFAASFEDVEAYEFEDSVLKLADLGIINGYPDGTFKPDNLVTRAEFAKMIVCMLGLDAAAKSLEGEAVPFADVDADHWAAGYINVAQMMGIVNGYEDGTFRPEGNITYAEALKMVLAAMGYSEDGFLVVRWPATWIAKAIELELDKDLTIVSGLAITRGEVAKLFDNSLTKKHVVVKDGEFVERDPAVTFMSKLKVNYIEGQVIDSPELWTNTSDKVKIDGKTDKDEAKTLSFAIDDFEGLFGHNVRVWYKGSKALGVEVLSTEKVLTAKEYKKIDEPDLIFINFIEGEYDEEDNLQYKGAAFSVADADEIVVVYDGSTPIAVKAVEYQVGVITDIYSYGKRMDVYLKSGTLKLYDFDVEYVGVDGFDDLKEGDILHYIYDAKNASALIIVARDVVKGTLTEITYDNKIKVDGKAFSADTTIVNALQGQVGKVVTLYLDKDGKVFDYKVASTPDAVYGVVQAIASRVVDKKVRTFHKVLTLEGEVEYIFAGTGTGPDVGDVVEITLEDDEATYTVLEEEDTIDKIEGKVKKRDTEKITIVVDINEEGEEVTKDVYYTKNTLWVEGEPGEYVERPLPYIDDEVTVYVYTDPEDGNKDKVAVGIIE
jgi:hypothetical protein